MKINELKINAFGNIKNKQIKLDNGINIIYGKNESGKSTILKFITDMFYGISKNKKGKDISDYDKYKPWIGEEFSGNIIYTLDNNLEFEVYRDFNKKNPQIFNDKLEDISKNYSIDKTNGNLFFYEQTGLDEQTYLSSITSTQENVRLNNNVQNAIIQKMSNIINSGDDSISYKKAMEKLDKKQLEEIGTSRSIGRPINIINKKIDELKIEKNKLIENKEKLNKIEDEEKIIDKKIFILNNKKIIINKLIENKNNNKINNEKIKINKNIIDENNKKINELIINKNNFEENIQQNEIENKIKNKTIERDKINIKIKKSKYIQAIIMVLTILLSLICIMITKNKIAQIACVACIPVIWFFIYIINKKKYKIKNNIEKEIDNLKQSIIFEENENNNKLNLIDSEINLLKNNINELNLEIKINNEKIIEKNNLLKKYLIEENKNILSEKELNEIINEENIEKIKLNIDDELNNYKIKIYSIELEKNKINNNLEKLSEVEEELISLNEDLNLLNYNNEIINLTKQALTEAYEKMKNTISPKFIDNLSENISKISNDKYNKVNISDQYGLIIQVNNGNYMPASLMSTGTIDQMYLSLRIAMMESLTKENMPIILDETFAYFDNERLNNILQFIINKYPNKQIIIFTCTNREKNILDKNGSYYNYIEI